MITLTTLVESALAAVPGLAYREANADGHANRADAAVRLIDEHQVSSLGIQYGLDWWEVGHYRVSIKNGTCTCNDMAAPIAGKARLCKHMLAAMFTRKLDLAQKDRLADIFAKAPGDRVTINLDVMGKGNNIKYWLNGYHYPGQPWQFFSYEERRQINQAMLDDAMSRGGFRIGARPSKQPGFAHHYLTVRIGSLADEGSGEVWDLRHMTAENSRRFAQLTTDHHMLERAQGAW